MTLCSMFVSDDELRPISCTGSGNYFMCLYHTSHTLPILLLNIITDTLGGYSLTLLDALDSLVLFGQYEDFHRSVDWIVHHLSFDIDKNVSVFETNIRLLGSLLSAHLLCSDGMNRLI